MLFKQLKKIKQIPLISKGLIYEFYQKDDMLKICTYICLNFKSICKFSNI